MRASQIHRRVLASDSALPLDSHAALHDVRVNLSDSVDGVRADHAQVSHVDPLRVSFFDQRHPPQAIRVVGKQGRHPLRRETASEPTQTRSSRSKASAELGRCAPYIQVFLVDVVDDQQVSRQQLFKHVNRPALQRLGQHRVVGVRTGAAGDVPGLRAHTQTHTQVSHMVSKPRRGGALTVRPCPSRASRCPPGSSSARGWSEPGGCRSAGSPPDSTGSAPVTTTEEETCLLEHLKEKLVLSPSPETCRRTSAPGLCCRTWRT